jgi:hypothetical protein
MPLTLLQIGRILFAPNRVFAQLADSEPSAVGTFFGLTLWLAVCPPIFTYIGTTRFGWLLGVEPIVLPGNIVLGVSLAYLAMLLVGFFSTTIVSRWMAQTYGASDSLGLNFALITIVGAPLAVGSIVHLYPHAFINVLVLVPVLIWSLYLLYRGLPVVLKTGPERGMLMASALVAYLLVAWVTLIGVTVVLWSLGFGPTVGV